MKNMWTTFAVIIVLASSALARNVYPNTDGRYYSIVDDAKSQQRLKLTASRQPESTEHYEGFDNHDYYSPTNVEPSLLEPLYATARTHPAEHSERSFDYFNEYPSDLQSYGPLQADVNSQTGSTDHYWRPVYPDNEHSRNADFSYIPEASGTENFGSTVNFGRPGDYYTEYPSSIQSSATHGEYDTERDGLTEYPDESENLLRIDPTNESSEHPQSYDTAPDTESTDTSGESWDYSEEDPGPVAYEENSGIQTYKLAESTDGLDHDVKDYPRDTESLQSSEVINTEEAGSTEYPRQSENDMGEYLDMTVSGEKSEEYINERTKSIESSEESDYDDEDYPNITESSRIPEASDTEKTGFIEHSKAYQNYNAGAPGMRGLEEKLGEDKEDAIKSNERLEGSSDDVQGYPGLAESSQASDAINTEDTATTQYSDRLQSNVEEPSGITVTEKNLEETTNAQPELIGRFGESNDDPKYYPSITESSEIPEAIDTEESDIGEPSSITATGENLDKATSVLPELTARFGEFNDVVKDYPRVTDSSETPEAIDTVVTESLDYSDVFDSNVPALEENLGNDTNSQSGKETPESIDTGETGYTEQSGGSENEMGEYPCNTKTSKVPETNVIGETGSIECSNKSDNHVEKYPCTTEYSNAPGACVTGKIESTKHSKRASNYVDEYPSDITTTLPEFINENHDMQSNYSETSSEYLPDFINEELNPAPAFSGKTAVSSNDGNESNAHQLHCPTVELTSEQIALVCPTGFRRHTKYCNIFYQCTANKGFHYKVTMFNCPSNTAFDDRRIQCLPLDELTVPCSNQKLYNWLGDDNLKTIPVNDACLCPGVGHYPHQHQLCSTSFYKCKLRNEGSIEGYYHDCPPGHVYWSMSRRCEELKHFPVCENK